MFGLTGTISVVAGTVLALVLVIRSVRVSSGASPITSSGPITAAQWLLVAAVGAFASLELAILTNDFSIVYVANHHARTTPFPFDVATGWAALEGSIVLWGLVLALYVWLVARDHKRRPERLSAGALAVMGVVALFFFGVMATIANPFETCTTAAEVGCDASSPIPLIGAEAPTDGVGPNPLLQNHLLMAIHPPVLYLGYVGMTAPFAFAMAALALRQPGGAWLARSKRWTMTAWAFLTLGIVLGSWWAYEVLSWGGYWAWDPVENASFMPWLIATAFLHSSLVQQRRGMLQSWNFVLVISTFALTIFGTYLTRSGTFVSVHSFTQSPIGPALLGFLVFVTAGGFALFAVRAEEVAQPSRMETLASREGAFLANNLLLASFGMMVLVGTIYPTFVEAFSGRVVQVGRPFFDRMAVPLSFGLLLAMGLGSAMPWRVARPGLVWERIHGPLQAALLAGVATVLLVTRIGWVVLAVTLGTFVAAVPIRHLWAESRKIHGVSRSTAITRVVSREPGFWGGQLSHAGVALMAVALASLANLGTHAEVTIEPGDTVEFAGYSITYDAPFVRNEPNRRVEGVRLAVARDGEHITTLEPRVNHYAGASQGILTPSVYSRPTGDLYATLRTSVADGRVVVTLDTSPVVALLWLGGLTAAAGGGVALRRRATRVRDRTQIEPAHA